MFVAPEETTATLFMVNVRNLLPWEDIPVDVRKDILVVVEDVEVEIYKLILKKCLIHDHGK